MMMMIERSEIPSCHQIMVDETDLDLDLDLIHDGREAICQLAFPKNFFISGFCSAHNKSWQPSGNNILLSCFEDFIGPTQ